MRAARQAAKAQEKQHEQHASSARQHASSARQLDLIDAYKASVPLEVDLYTKEEIRQAELRYYRLLGR